jgi:peptidoglycan-N-acetylglucosamine deacetylase
MTAQERFFITTSWDDGTVHDLKLADLLSKYQLPATFYVAKHHEYGCLEESQIRALGQCFELGAHTVNHVVLDTVSDELAEKEIRNSKSWIEQLSGRQCQMFCFPRGKFSRRHVRMVKEACFRGARTVELMSCRTASLVLDLAVLPTTVQAFPHHTSAYLRNILRRRRVSNLVNYLRSERGDWTRMAGSLLSRISSSGGVFHLWGHAWEVDQFDLWLDLERLFQVLEQYKSRGAALATNADLCRGVAN